MDASGDRHFFVMKVFHILLPALILLVGAGNSLGQNVQFTDTSASAGISTGAGATGVSAVDFDNDGWDDITLALNGLRPALFRNRHDGTFENIAETAGIKGGGNLAVVLWADINRDGFPDLFVGQRTGGHNALYVNNGDGTFRDIAASAGIDTTASVGSAAFGDFDEDGYVDLFLAIDRAPDLLYENAGDLTFKDVSVAAAVQGPPDGVAMQATWIDFDLDGDLDLFATHDGTTPSRLHINPGHLPLLDGAAEARIADTGSGNSMGIAWGDINGDGWPDAYVSRIGRAGLYLNDRSGHFTDVAVDRGAEHNGMSWGVVFADFDNDADDDIFVVSTSGFDGTPTLLYQNTDGQFSEMAAAAGISIQIEAMGLATGDFNNDGLVDLVIPSGSGAHRLYLNSTVQPGNWINISVFEPNHVPVIGARVDVFSGGRHLVRTVGGGDSYCSQSSAMLHFGIGDEFVVESVTVTGRNGSQTTTATLGSNLTHVLSTSLTFTAVDGPFSGRRDVPQRDDVVLHANYPDPFSVSTLVSYDLPSPGPVQLSVYDMLGRLVFSSIRRQVSAGGHETRLPGNNLAAGRYVYRLTTDSGTKSGDMTVVR